MRPGAAGRWWGVGEGGGVRLGGGEGRWWRWIGGDGWVEGVDDSGELLEEDKLQELMRMNMMVVEGRGMPITQLYRSVYTCR